jgi:hypothetical protein
MQRGVGRAERFSVATPGSADTLVFVALQLTMRQKRLWSGFLALASSLAALLMPVGAGTVSAEAALLAIGALSALAGHRWGSLVILAAHVPLVGRCITLVGMPLDVVSITAIALVIITLVPTVLWSMALVPQLMHEVWPNASVRWRSAGVTCIVLLLSMALVAPALADHRPQRGETPMARR